MTFLNEIIPFLRVNAEAFEMCRTKTARPLVDYGVCFFSRYYTCI